MIKLSKEASTDTLKTLALGILATFVLLFAYSVSTLVSGLEDEKNKVITNNPAACDISGGVVETVRLEYSVHTLILCDNGEVEWDIVK